MRSFYLNQRELYECRRISDRSRFDMVDFDFYETMYWVGKFRRKHIQNIDKRRSPQLR